MIILINGPLGAGKTEVAWKVIEKFDLAERHRNDRARYSDSKTEFVQRVLSTTKFTK